jgi:hypothetical protein
LVLVHSLSDHQPSVETCSRLIYINENQYVVVLMVIGCRTHDVDVYRENIFLKIYPPI